MDIVRHLSPNFGPRKHGRAPDMVVIHYTAMETAEAAIERLCDPLVEVSAHYVISKDGAVTQLVSEDHRAWHAGQGCWAGITDVNSHSIGIELDYCDGDFPENQITALETLLAAILKRHHIPLQNVIGHSDMAPARKFDPGPMFPWQRMAQKQLSVWPSQDLPIHVATVSQMWNAFLTDATKFGYRAPIDPNTGWQDERGWHVTLRAFRERFSLPLAENITPLDCATIRDLAERFPTPIVDTRDTVA